MNYKRAKFHLTTVTPSWSAARLLSNPLYILTGQSALKRDIVGTLCNIKSKTLTVTPISNLPLLNDDSSSLKELMCLDARFQCLYCLLCPPTSVIVILIYFNHLMKTTLEGGGSVKLKTGRRGRGKI